MWMHFKVRYKYLITLARLFNDENDNKSINSVSPNEHLDK